MSVMFDCLHRYQERDENYTLDMCDIHPEKIWGVSEKDCEKCPLCPDKDWQAWKHSLHDRVSAVISDVEIPDEREWIDVRIFRDGTAIVTGERARREEHKVIFLPPHGRLVDADALLESDLGGEPYKSVIRRVLMQAPTVIEVERSN